MVERATIALIGRGDGQYEIDDTVVVGELHGELPQPRLWTVRDLEAAALSLGWLLDSDEREPSRRHLYFRRTAP